MWRSLDLQGKRVGYTLARSARVRWARLEIHLHRGVRVVLPERAPESDAEKLIRAKSKWLLRAIARFERLRKIVPERRYESGERLPYLDEILTLEVSVGPRRVERRGAVLAVAVPRRVRGPIRAALEEWYAERAAVELAARAARFGIKFAGIRISRAQTRWGSCSASGRISLNWRLMLAPSAIADYLIAHELAHVGHRDHSPAFWARVGEIHPAYRDAERWLRKNGAGVVL